MHVVVSTVIAGSTKISCVCECHEPGSSVIVVREGSRWLLSCLRGGGAILQGGWWIRRIGSGEGVDILSGWLIGITSANGPISDSSTGKNNSPLIRPMPTKDTRM